MKVLQKIKTKSKEWIEKFESKNHVKYVPELREGLPTYILVDDELKKQTKIELQYNEKTLGYNKVKIPVVFSQADINYFRSSGHIVEVFDDEKLKQIEIEKQAFVELLEDARLEGYEQAKNELIGVKIV